MMRTNVQPLAHLVDAAAETWLAADALGTAERNRVETEITRKFHIGDLDELTFHGLRYQLTITRDGEASSNSNKLTVGVHEIGADD